MAATARALIEAGAVGLNLEDGVEEVDLVPVEQHVAKVRALRETSEALGMHVVINARTDVYLTQVGQPASRLEHAVQRLNAYRAAGADSLFLFRACTTPRRSVNWSGR
jgi:2-methylisocitrate lyase-like PEP mutase family enzyme